MAAVKEEKLLLTEAADVMGLCYRPAKRVWARYKAQGDKGLVHRGFGFRIHRRELPGKPDVVLPKYKARRP